MDLPLLLEPEQLETVLGNENLLILDVSNAANYAKFHVPGAIHIPPSSLVCGIKPATGKLPSAEQLSALFSAVGLTADKHVIAYDDEGGGWAGRLIWTLDVLGHKKYSYLNGGLHSWVNEGHSSEQTPNSGTPSNFTASINHEPIIEAEDIIAQLGNDKMGIWDARSAEEHAGSKVVSLRGGRIPGAKNIDWLELMDRDRNLRLIDLEQLQQRMDTLGLSKDKTIVTHCQTHHRSGLSYLAMKLLDYPSIKGYHGSWSEWGNREDTPIESDI
jgi:thiosulfate/3-mercaptopyruvate sulfurtransferase